MTIDRRQFFAGGLAASALVLGGPGLRAQASGYSIPIRLTDRRVLVDCLLDGRGPWPFVIDTGGAVGLMDERAAKALKLEAVGKSALAIHGLRRKYDIMLVERLSFGGIIDQKGAVFAATDNVTFHDDAIGSLAAGALTSVESELDFDALEWRVYPDGGPNRDDWHRVDKAFVRGGNAEGSSWIFASIGIGGQQFPSGLDTGAPGELRLSGEAMRASGLWDSPRWAPGGPDGKGRIVRVPELTFGGVTLKNVIAALNPESQFEYFDNGLVGLPILQRFHIATLPDEDALLLRRNSQPDPAPCYNRAGIWVGRAGADLTVVEVGPGSPAAHAGIAKGDCLLGADFYRTIDAMHGQAGEKLSLRVKSGDKTRDLELVLADYL